MKWPAIAYMGLAMIGQIYTICSAQEPNKRAYGVFGLLLTIVVLGTLVWPR